jgi:hypothetical protein
MPEHECKHGPVFVFLRQERRKDEFGSRSRVVVEDIFFCQHCLHHERRTVREWEEPFEASTAE